MRRLGPLHVQRLFFLRQRRCILCPCLCPVPAPICLSRVVWPSEARWRHRFGSTLHQGRSCCLTAPRHYLNQCCMIIKRVLWYSPGGNYIGMAPDVNLEKKNTFKIISTFLRAYSVNSSQCMSLLTIIRYKKAVVIQKRINETSWFTWIISNLVCITDQTHSIS